MSAHILVAEDQADIRDLIALNLRHAGYAVTPVADGRAALDRQSEHGSDLLILDLMMPGLDGLEVCKALRAKGGATPILMLTAKSTELDRVLGLELGADDYLTKPFSPRELVARVAAVLRRTSAQVVPAPRPVLAIGPVTIDRDRHAVRVGDAELVVTATELRLLATLALHKGRVLSRSQLIATVYGDDHHISARTIDTHVRNLRAKLAAAGAPVIETVHGVGYRCS